LGHATENSLSDAKALGRLTVARGVLDGGKDAKAKIEGKGF